MYFSINDASYWYEVHGDGIPLVMLHGFTGSTVTWKQFIAKREKGIKIITIDLPGHGKTQTPSPKSMEACCTDLMELFNHLQLNTFHLLGYSMGGRTALSFAMHYPEKVQSLILESASPGLKREKERMQRVEKDESLARMIESEGLDSFIHFWEGIPLFDSQKNLSKKQQEAVRMERLSQTAQGLTQSLHAMGTGAQPSWWGMLHQIMIPVLLLVGAYDSKFIQINSGMKDLLPNSHFEVIEDAGHAIHVEQSDIFGKMVNGFIFSSC